MKYVDPHARFRELIAARLDRPLTRVELRSLNAHLKKCERCQAVDVEYRTHRNMLRALPPRIPPRDLWARTSARLDREVGRDYRAQKWGRRLARGRRSAQPSTALMTAIAALGVSAAIAVLQLAPAFTPAPSNAGMPTPLAVLPQSFAFVGIGPGDVAVYRTEVSQVCPSSAPLDCVDKSQIVRTPVELPPSMRSSNIALSPSGDELAVVGHYVGQDVIAVVMMPGSAETTNGGGNGKSNSGPSRTAKANDGPDSTVSSGSSVGQQQPGQKTNAPAQSAGTDSGPAASSTGATEQDPGTLVADAASPPQSAVPGLAVLSILENVKSAGSPPQWSPNGSTLAFSAMPDDGSRGPDVYVWSPGDEAARPITDDHDSFFASWSGPRIVMSRLARSAHRPHNFVIDPRTSEERPVNGPAVWLPTVDPHGSEAVGWYGQLDTTGTLPVPRTGSLYLMDWASIDPFGAGAPQPTATPASTPEPTPSATPAATPTASPTPTPTPMPTRPAPPTPRATPVRTLTATASAPATPQQHKSQVSSSAAARSTSTVHTMDEQHSPSPTIASDATTPIPATPTAATATPASPTPTATATPTPTQSPTPAATATSPAATATPTEQPEATTTDDPETDLDAPTPAALTPLVPDRDPRSSPVVDWQVRWSADGQVLGVWIADSAGSTWGQLAVLAVDPATQHVSLDNPLLPMTLARRGFSLGQDRVAWVGPSDDNVDGELRIRAWGSDGVGGLRLKAPDQEEVVPAF